MAIPSVRSILKIKTRSSGSKTCESFKISPPRRQNLFQTSRRSQHLGEYRYQMSNRHLTKAVPPKKRKTYQKTLPKSQARLEQGEKKTGPPKKKTRPIDHPRSWSRAELEDQSSQLQRVNMGTLSTRSSHNSPRGSIRIGKRTLKSRHSRPLVVTMIKDWATRPSILMLS